MEDIQTKALKTFSANMEFLSVEDKDLFKNLSILQQALESGQYKENFALEYLDSGYFDVKNLHDNSWLYGSNSDEFAQKKADEITFEKLDQSFSMMYRRSYKDVTIDDFGKFSALNTPLALSAPIENSVAKLKGRTSTLKQIYKFAFLGVGLGTHVGTIHEKIKAKSYVFMENNIELFYLSLFVCDYTVLKGSKLFFIVMKNDDETTSILTDFYEDLSMRNDFLKYTLFSDNYSNHILQIQNMITSQNPEAYSYARILLKNIRVLDALHEEYKFLNISRIYKNSPFANKKVLLLALGPSLNKNLQWLKENRDKFILVSVFAAAPKLKEAGLDVDVFVHVDERAWHIKETFDKVNSKEYFQNSHFVGLASLPLDIVSRYIDKNNIYLIQHRTRYKNNHGNVDMYSVGEATFMVTALLGANNIYLLGLDLALDQESGKTHDDSYKHGIDVDMDGDIDENMDMQKNTIKVKGNKLPEVVTTFMFNASRYALNIWINENITNQRIYNLSNGAYFDKTIPLDVEDVAFDMEDGRYVKNELKSFLDSISTDRLSKKEIVDIDLRKKYVKLRARQVRKFSTSSAKSVNQFYDNFLDLATRFFMKPNDGFDEMRSIFVAYLNGILSYVGEYLNTKDAHTSRRSLEMFRDCISTQLFKIFYIISQSKYMDIGNFEKYSNEECKYFEKMPISEWFAYRYADISQINELNFMTRIYNNELSQSKKIDEKIVGILAFMPNLRDVKFMEKISHILSKDENIKVCGFYFMEEEMDVFLKKMEEHKSRVICQKLEHVSDLVQNANIFLSNSFKYVSDDMIYEYLKQNYENIEAFKSNEELIV